MTVEVAKKKFLSRGLGMSHVNGQLIADMGHGKIVRVAVVNGDVTKAEFNSGLDQVSSILRDRRE